MVKDFIRRLLFPPRKEFFKICHANGVTLNFPSNKKGLSILREIFVHRTYSNYFPFYTDAIILDIGAHYGYFSLFAAANLTKKARIIAIEPSQINFDTLQKNILENHVENVETMQVAVGQVRGRGRLYLSSDHNNSFFHRGINPLSSDRFQEVAQTRLEDLFVDFKLDRIDFLKMDCEGAEYPILENMSPKVFEKISTISLEFHDLKQPNRTGLHLVKLLKENGFKIVQFQHNATHLNLNHGLIVATKN